MKRNVRTPNDFIIEDPICKIGCYNRECELVCYAIIDLDDMEKCTPYKWYFGPGYVVNDKVGFLHHFILGMKPSREVIADHINVNVLDNRKDNLRRCSYSQNNVNRETRSSTGYRGVTKRGDRNSWFAQITKNGIGYKLGNFNDPVEAALAYDEAAKRMHGDFARLNFGE